jgi:hypothetical protein
MILYAVFGSHELLALIANFVSHELLALLYIIASLLAMNFWHLSLVRVVASQRGYVRFDTHCPRLLKC